MATVSFNATLLTAPFAAILGGLRFTIASVASGMVLTARDRVVQEPWTGDPRQHWRIRTNGDGTVRLENVASGQVLDVRGGGKQAGAELLTWAWHGGANQRFRIGDLAGASRIDAVHSGLTLDVQGGSRSAGAPILQWSWHGGDNQRWRIAEVPQVTLYEHADYAGNAQRFDVGRHDLAALGRVGNDRVSSARVPAGLRALLYEHAGFTGRVKQLDADAPRLADFNDVCSGLVVEIVQPATPTPTPTPTPGPAPTPAPIDGRGDRLTLGTLLPRTSPWGQVLTLWAAAVHEKTGGRFTLEIRHGGADDEGAQIAAMKAGELDGVVASAVGLGKLHRPALALQLPGLLTTWSRIDAAREALRVELEDGLATAGARVLGWFDIGAARLLARGVAARRPADLHGKHVCTSRDNLASPPLFTLLGGATAVPLPLLDVRGALERGAVQVVVAPALVAEQLQWESQLDTVVADVVGAVIGAIAVSSQRHAALTPDLQAILRDTARAAVHALATRIRAADDAAFQRLCAARTVVSLTADERSAWGALFQEQRRRLAQGLLPPEFLARVEALAT